MNLMKQLLKIAKFLFDLGVFCLAALLMFSLAYYFTWTLLIGSFNWGSDMAFHLSFADYLARYYPYIPRWNYSWGGGMPFLYIYPPLATVATVFYHKLSGLTIVQAVRLFCWLAVPLTASAVVLLGKLVARNWLVGILAGIMMLFSPDSWLWATQGGFYAFFLSVPFFAWATVFYTAALKKSKKLLLVLALIFYGLTWLAHPMSATVLTLTFLILGVGFSWQKKQGLKKGFLKSLAIIALGAFLVSWWILPFYFARREAVFFGAEQAPFASLKELVGLEEAHDGVYVTTTFFTASVVILFFAGALAAFLRKSFVRFLAGACFLALFIVVTPKYFVWLTDKLLYFWQSTNVRAVLILKILGPIVAAFGAVSLARPPFWLLEKLAPGLKKFFLWRGLGNICGGLAGAFVFWFLVSNIVIIPPFKKGTGGFYQGFGPLYTWGIIKNQEGELFDAQREVKLFPKLETIPKVIISGPIRVDNIGKSNLESLKAISEKVGLADEDRIEIPPFTGAFCATFTSAFPASVAFHCISASIIPGMIGWQAECFYEEGFCGTTEVEDLARWFGISQVWAKESERTKLIAKSDLFEYVETEVEIKGERDLWPHFDFKDSTGLASITNKPAILVIGDNPPNNDVFHKTFKVLSKIDFGYQQAWSVNGKRFIDSYSLDELSQFDLVFLHGYQYKSAKKAWDLLAEYLENGGKVFINTGWQYKVPEWGRMENGNSFAVDLPKVFPVKKSLWGDIGSDWENKKWDRPLWDGKPWGMAIAEKDWLRQGAEPLLVDQDKVLAASWDYGQGRAVWTGFDFFGHLAYYQGTEDEKLFLKNIFLKLTDNQKIWEEKVHFDRLNPDLVKIPLSQKASGNKLLFKEADWPGWEARPVTSYQLPAATSKRLKIYRAGPGWKMVFLPGDFEGGELVFEYGKAWYEWLGIALTFLTAFGLAIYLTGTADKKIIRIKNKASALFKSKFKNFKAKWNDEQI